MMSHYGVSALYNYNADGLRTKKMYGGTATTYYWANGLLLFPQLGPGRQLYRVSEHRVRKYLL